MSAAKEISVISTGIRCREYCDSRKTANENCTANKIGGTSTAYSALHYGSISKFVDNSINDAKKLVSLQRYAALNCGSISTISEDQNKHFQLKW